MTHNENISTWKERIQEINKIRPEAIEFLVKSGVEEKDRLIFTALNDMQKLYESPMVFIEIETVRGGEPLIVGESILNSFYCLWILEWGENQGISVKLSTNSSAYSPVMSIKGRTHQDEVFVIPTDDEQKFLKCLGDCFLIETKAIL